jgi:hypothetical protein
MRVGKSKEKAGVHWSGVSGFLKERLDVVLVR